MDMQKPTSQFSLNYSKVKSGLAPVLAPSSVSQPAIATIVNQAPAASHQVVRQ